MMGLEASHRHNPRYHKPQQKSLIISDKAFFTFGRMMGLEAKRRTATTLGTTNHNKKASSFLIKLFLLLGE